MIITLDLPDEISSRLIALLPEDSYSRFAVSAIAEALLVEEYDPQDTIECAAAVDEALDDVQMGRSIPFEDEKVRWESKKSTILNIDPTSTI